MFISLAYSRAHGFRKWSERQLTSGKDANQAEGATSNVIAGPPVGEPGELP
jgi:hypothetical protein